MDGMLTSLMLHEELTERYEPLRVLGYGAFATVMKARDRRDGRLVAIKHFVTPDGQRRKFFQELTVIMQLSHPYIVQCLDLCNAGHDSSDLILELAEGGSLREGLLGGQTWPLQRAFTVVLHVAQALSYAHGQGVVHRDLKPENILRFGAGATTLYKLTDFGIAKFIGMSGQAKTSIGSPAYMAPEQFYDRYDFKTDLYALGVVLYELLHGMPPFQGSPVEILHGHVERPVALTPMLPSDVAHLLSALLAKQPDARPSAQQLLGLVQDLGRAHGFTFPAMPVETPMMGTPPAAPVSQVLTGASLFDAFCDDELPAPGPPSRVVPAAPPSLSRPESQSATSLFGEDFEDAIAIADPAQLCSTVAQAQAASVCGHVSLTQQWTRAVDTKSMHLANVDEGDAILVLTRTGMHGLHANGGKGTVLYHGPSERLGTPGQGTLPICVGREVHVLQAGTAALQQWALHTDVQQICFAPEAQAAAVVVGARVYYHDQDGTLCWSGIMDTQASEVRVAFEGADTLMVLGYDSDDQGVYFYNRAGHAIAQYWLPGRIVAATRCRFATGAWVIIATARGPQVLRIALDGVLAGPQPIPRPLRRLIGARGWLCGLDETETLQVLDPMTGSMAPVTVAGHVLDYEHGLEEEQLYVLEGRGELLRYVTVFTVELRTTR